MRTSAMQPGTLSPFLNLSNSLDDFLFVSIAQLSPSCMKLIKVAVELVVTATFLQIDDNVSKSLPKLLEASRQLKYRWYLAECLKPSWVSNRHESKKTTAGKRPPIWTLLNWRCGAVGLPLPVSCQLILLLLRTVCIVMSVSQWSLGSSQDQMIWQTILFMGAARNVQQASNIWPKIPLIVSYPLSMLSSKAPKKMRIFRSKKTKFRSKWHRSGPRISRLSYIA